MFLHVIMLITECGVIRVHAISQYLSTICSFILLNIIYFNMQYFTVHSFCLVESTKHFNRKTLFSLWLCLRCTQPAAWFLNRCLPYIVTVDVMLSQNLTLTFMLSALSSRSTINRITLLPSRTFVCVSLIFPCISRKDLYQEVITSPLFIMYYHSYCPNFTWVSNNLSLRYVFFFFLYRKHHLNFFHIIFYAFNFTKPTYHTWWS